LWLHTRLVGAGVLERFLDRRVGVENQAVVIAGDGVRPLGVPFDDDHLVARPRRDIDERSPDIARPDDDDVHMPHHLRVPVENVSSSVPTGWTSHPTRQCRRPTPGNTRVSTN
jgi:hypothetical protein